MTNLEAARQYQLALEYERTVRDQARTADEQDEAVEAVERAYAELMGAWIQR